MTSRTPDDASRPRSRRTIANGDRLAALGAAIDAKDGKRPVKGRHATPQRNPWIRRGVIGALVIALLGGGFVGGGYLYAQYEFSKIHKFSSAGEVAQLGGQPFNILEIGSDSRVGLTGSLAATTGANSVSGQRSDVVKIMHVDPIHQTITVLSIPRDTIMTLLANQATYGRFNRLNVNFGNGPALVAQTITANLGIPIAHTIVVSFAGLVNAADAIGGVHMYFPYPAHDPMSNLKVPTAGCHLITNAQALALTRSRHYYWYQNGQWNYDVTSDYGRIYRQDEFIKAFINQAKTMWNPLTINNLLAKLPQGISLDSNFSLNDLLALAYKFHGMNANAMSYYTLATAPGQSAALGDVLYVNEPSAQEQLVKIFGSQLLRPTAPPPNVSGATPMPPVITTTTTVAPVVTKTTTGAAAGTGATHAAPTTTTTQPVEGDQYFDPYPC